MELTKMINEGLIDLELDASDQLGVIEQMASLLEEQGRIDSKSAFTQGVLEREQQFTTGFGNGIAIPHCKSSTVNNASIAIGKLTNGVDWKAMDDADVSFVIMLAVPDAEGGSTHLQLLSRLSGNLMDEDFRDGLMSVTAKEDVLRLLTDSMTEKSN
ncbi:PTS sugar transporter subunit IIA [Mangrovibacillus sp. Mu-81]|uniref:PTS sugar transporter subunit IIA n=1 Tax=Mangrovibacillus sp. Mu-81 TaxID=3121478 RepID=UPI002FE4924D